MEYARLMFKGRISSDFEMNPNLFPRILLGKHNLLNVLGKRIMRV